MGRVAIIILTSFGLLFTTCAIGLLGLAIGKQQWLILPNMDTNDDGKLTDTYYSGLWEFCGVVPGNTRYPEGQFCLPAEVEKDKQNLNTEELKLNALQGSWRSTTLDAALASISMAVITWICVVVTYFTCCSPSCVRFVSLPWLLSSLVSMLVALGTIIYFVVTLTSDPKKMYYSVGQTNFQRHIGICVYFFGGAVASQFISLVLAGIVTGLSLKTTTGYKGARAVTVTNL